MFAVPHATLSRHSRSARAYPIQFHTRLGSVRRMTVYGADGRFVKRLAKRWLTPGSYTARRDGVTETGQVAASGVYFVALESAHDRDTRKITLAK